VTHTISHDLCDLPAGALPHGVTARPAEVAGRRSVRVELLDELSLHGRAGIDYVDQPTFLVIPSDFSTGTIEVDLWSTLNGKGPADARAFAGLAYRISKPRDTFESVYLRPLNGRKVGPPAPRDRRAIQYFSFPDWPFDRLRDTYPDGRYESGLTIGPEEWITLRVDVRPGSVTATVNGVEDLTIGEPKATPARGDIGLFVDIGTEAYFADLIITSDD